MLQFQTTHPYNPEYVTEEEASSWKILTNPKFRCQVTMKDNVRDAYFAAMGIYKSEKLHDLYMRTLYENNTERSNALLSAYPKQLKKEMNDTSLQTIKAIETILRDNRNNFYSFESDSGKSDMVTGKVVANLQWSGDGVYSLDQAEEDGIYLNFSVPYECSNLWFDGWVMCKKGLEENAEKKQACEAFVNFLSMPDNVVRNMQYVGYTSVIAGYEDDTIFEYIDWCYGAPEEQTDVADYDISAFFGRNDAVVTTSSDQLKRQLYAQYPPKDVLDRCAIMEYLDDETTKLLNQMWINVRCYKLP